MEVLNWTKLNISNRLQKVESIFFVFFFSQAPTSSPTAFPTAEPSVGITANTDSHMKLFRNPTGDFGLLGTK